MGEICNVFRKISFKRLEKHSKDSLEMAPVFPFPKVFDYWSGFSLTLEKPNVHPPPAFQFSRVLGWNLIKYGIFRRWKWIFYIIIDSSDILWDSSAFLVGFDLFIFIFIWVEGSGGFLWDSPRRRWFFRDSFGVLSHWDGASCPLVQQVEEHWTLNRFIWSISADLIATFVVIGFFGFWLKDVDWLTDKCAVYGINQQNPIPFSSFFFNSSYYFYFVLLKLWWQFEIQSSISPNHGKSLFNLFINSFPNYSPISCLLFLLFKPIHCKAELIVHWEKLEIGWFIYRCWSEQLRPITDEVETLIC